MPVQLIELIHPRERNRQKYRQRDRWIEREIERERGRERKLFRNPGSGSGDYKTAEGRKTFVISTFS